MMTLHCFLHPGNLKYFSDNWFWFFACHFHSFFNSLNVSDFFTLNVWFQIYVVSLEEENYEMEMRRVLKDECSENWDTMEKLTLSVIVRLLLFDVLCQVGAVTVHYLHWNSSNPIFRIDNTDHIVDVNQGNHQNKTLFL